MQPPCSAGVLRPAEWMVGETFEQVLAFHRTVALDVVAMLTRPLSGRSNPWRAAHLHSLSGSSCGGNAAQMGWRRNFSASTVSA